jgi:hypothetical protein
MSPNSVYSIQFEGQVVDPAVPPGLAGFEAAYERMIGVGLVVLASVVVLGLIAAPDVTARGAHAEMYPGRAD